MIKITVRNIIEDSSTRYGKVFALVIQGFIVLSIISFSIDTIPGLSSNATYVLYVIELLTVILFTIEYITRIIVTEKKLAFIFSFYGLVDLIAILPFYIATGLDLRAIRIFRLLRLFRIFKLFRYNSAIKRFHRALVIAKEELVLFGLVTLVLLYLAGVGIYYFENQAQPEHFKSVFHGLWWAVITLTTVGYGDVYPITLGGRLFTFIILMIGLGIVAIPTGLVASALAEARKEES